MAGATDGLADSVSSLKLAVSTRNLTLFKINYFILFDVCIAGYEVREIENAIAFSC